MKLRPYRAEDCTAIVQLFLDTVHRVNTRDYTPEQLAVWAPADIDLEKWQRSLSAHHSVVAVIDKVIVGFGDIDDSDYLDRLFVHHAHQGEGIGTAIVDWLENKVEGDITTEASITAQPFFLRRGYVVVREQTVERQGVQLTNFLMVKKRSAPTKNGM